MTISFSGLASGLDTSSWIKSLTALKQAKVTTLQQQKENILLSKNTLSSIKSFFSSFRSTIEKITDSKFNIASMNLFAQNLATSADLSVLTATATQEAKEGKYEVKVDKLASNTQAVSKNDYMTTKIERSTANEDTKLKDLANPVQSGVIFVTVNGSEHKIEITDDETIGSFIDKLQNIEGVRAEFNERTGVFSTNISANQIYDSDTGIVEALHLSSVNKGFTSNDLIVENEVIVYENAKGDTLLSALGVKDGTLTIIPQDGTEEDALYVTLNVEDIVDGNGDVINPADTVQTLIDALQNEGIDASIEDGVFTIKNAYISSEGTTGIFEAFGLVDSVAESVQTSTALVSATVTTTEVATEDTYLTALQGGSSVVDGATVIVKDEVRGETVITLDDEMKIGDLLQSMRDAGLSAEISEDGIVSISSGMITGGTVDVKALLGLTEEIISDSTLVSTKTIGIALTSNDVVSLKGMTDTSGLSALSEVDASNIVSGGTYKISSTTDMLQLAQLVDNGIQDFTGVTLVMSNDIDLSSIEDWNAIGDDSTPFKGTFDGNGYEISGLTILNSEIGNESLFARIEEATIKNLGLVDVDIQARGRTGALAELATISQIHNVYIKGSVQSLSFAGGMLGEAFGTKITSCQVTGTVVGGSVVGGLVGRMQYGTIAQSSTDANVYGLSSANVGGLVGRADGAYLSGVYSIGSVSGDNTCSTNEIGGLVGYAYQGVTINDSYTKATIPESSGAIVGSGSGRILFTKALSDNWVASCTGTVSTIGCTTITAETIPFTVTAKVAATNASSTTFAQIGLTSNAEVTIMSNGTESVYTVTTSNTIRDFVSYLRGKGFQANFVNGKFIIEGSENVYIKGELDDSLDKVLELDDVANLYRVESSGADLSTAVGSNQLLVSVVGTTTTINGSTTLGELGITDLDSLWITQSGSDSKDSILYSANVSATMTVDELLALVSQEASNLGGTINASVTNGVISFESPNGYKIEGTIATKLGLEVTGGAYGELTVGASMTSSTPVAYITTLPITGSTEISDFYTGNSVVTVRTSDGSIFQKQDTSSLTALSSVTASDMVSGATFKISTAAELEQLASIVNSGTNCSGVTFVLSNDIDLGAIANWTAIGNSSNYFSGIFDGNGYEIKNLKINSDTSYQGLFGYIRDANVSNLGVVGYEISGNVFVGALAGEAVQSSVRHVYTSGTLSADYCSGGLIGRATSVSIEHTEATGTIMASNTSEGYVGGLVGMMTSSTVVHSATDVILSGVSKIGGIAGYTSGSNLLRYVYANGDASVFDYANISTLGGLIGVINGDDVIAYSYSKMSTPTGSGSIVGSILSIIGTLELTNVNALNDNYVAEGTPTSAINCSVITADQTPFTVSSKNNYKDLNISGMTVDEMFSALNAYGVTGSLRADGRITFTSSDGKYVSGDFINDIGVTLSSTVISTTLAVDQASTATVMYTSTIVMTGTNKISDYMDLYTVSPTGTYTITGTINSDGSITGGSVVAINSSADMTAIGTGLAAGNTYAGYTFVLTTSNIGFNGSLGTVLDGTTIAFEGTIDGLGRSIALAGSPGGLFNYLNGTVKNLKITGGTNSAAMDTGKGAIANVMLGGTILNCTSSATVTGGMAGDIGIVGTVRGDVLISGVVVKSTLSEGGLGGSTAGIIGKVSSGTVTIKDSIVEGGVICNSSSNVRVGGIIGRINSGANVTLEDVAFTGTIGASTTDFGGLVGRNNGTLNLNNCITTSSSTLGAAFTFENYGTINVTGSCLTTENIAYFGGTGIVNGETKCYYNKYVYTWNTSFLGFGEQWASVEGMQFLQNLNAGAPEVNSDNVLAIRDSYKGILSKFTVTESTTFDDLMTWLNSNDITARMTDGVISLSGSPRCILEGTIAEDLGIASGSTTSTFCGAIYTKSTTIREQYSLGSTILSNMHTIAEVNGTINADGTITGGTIVAITSAADLIALGKSGTTYNGYHFIMTDDIDLGTQTWAGISLGVNSVFDGHGHTISGSVMVTQTDGTNGGFFRSLLGATVQNLTFKGSLSMELSATNFGFIGSVTQGTRGSVVANVFIEDSIIDARMAVTSLGGLIGSVSATSTSLMNNIDNVQISNTTILASGTVTNFGGVAGYATYAKLSNINITNDVSMIANSSVSNGIGGMVGTAPFVGIIDSFVGCKINIKGSYNSEYLGAVLGRETESNLQSNLNNVIHYVENIGPQQMLGSVGRGSTQYYETLVNPGTQEDMFANLLLSGRVNTSWYLDEDNNYRLVSPGSRFVSIYDETGKCVQETIFTGTSVTHSVFMRFVPFSACTLADGSIQFITLNDTYAKSGLFDQMGVETTTGTYTFNNGIYNNSSLIAVEEEHTLTEDTTWAELGVTEGCLSLKRVDNGETEGLFKIPINLSEFPTIGETAAKLAEYGITMTVENGIVSIDYDNSEEGLIYVFEHTGLTGHQEAMAALNINGGLHRTVNTTTTYSNATASVGLSIDVDNTLSSETRLVELGINTTDNEIVLNEQGTYHTIEFSNSITVGELVDSLNNIMGENAVTIEDGKVCINESHYAFISTIPSDIMSALNLSTDISDYTSIIVSNSPAETNSSVLSVSNNDGTMAQAGLVTKLGDIVDNNGNRLPDYVLDLGEVGSYTFDADTTIADVISRLGEDGIEARASSGKITISTNEDLTLSGGLGLLIGGTSPTIIGKVVNYTSGVINYDKINELEVTDDVKLEYLNLGITDGNFVAVVNGVSHKLAIDDNNTIGEFRELLGSVGIQSELIETAQGVSIKLTSDYDFDLVACPEDNPSNILEKLFSQEARNSYNYSSKLLKVEEQDTVEAEVTKDTLLSEFDNGTLLCEGTFNFTLDGEQKSITITSQDTFGSLIEKFESAGVSATLFDKQLKLNAFDKEFVVDSNSTSCIVENLNLVHDEALDGISSSTDTVIEEITTEFLVNGSVAAQAGLNTQMGLLNISSGTLSIYRKGEKCTVDVLADETFEQLQERIHGKFDDVYLKFNDGYLEMYSDSEGVDVKVGNTSDTSNFVSITGISADGDISRSSREMYKVIGTSNITATGMFARGDVTEGTFTVGNAEFTIDSTTTLNDIISQINSSAETNATAYWDSNAGKFCIKSRVTGATFINIEAGTSNFTDIMGFTTTERDVDGSIISTRLNGEAQEIGGNAEFSIDGTNYTSTTNTITSDISKINGLTLNLKDISNGEAVIVEVTKDYDTMSSAVSDIVDAYNELMTNVEKEIAADGNLKDQTTLKFIKNQIRNLMFGTVAGDNTFKTLSSIGISPQAASGTNISTDNINALQFDKDKFMSAYKADGQAVKNLLVGENYTTGIFSKIESVVEQALSSASGYFNSAENSYNKQIDRLDAKIERANIAVANYKSRLESKFQYMDMMISKMQEQFSTFLGT